MLEILLTLYILFAFIFPLPVFAASLVAWGAYLAHRICMMYRWQPGKGKKVFWLLLSASMVNVMLSLLLGVGLAFLVRLLFLDNDLLFSFNLIFCSLISLRWFNFTHLIFQYFTLKLKDRGFSTQAKKNSVFVVFFGLRQGTGINRGMIPLFTDAGFVELRGGAIHFQGVFSKQVFLPGEKFKAEKKSAEKINILFTGKRQSSHFDGFQIVLRDQFYPFRSRDMRDRLVETLQPREQLEPLAA